jgi:hypothetical protein
MLTVLERIESFGTRVGRATILVGSSVQATKHRASKKPMNNFMAKKYSFSFCLQIVVDSAAA